MKRSPLKQNGKHRRNRQSAKKKAAQAPISWFDRHARLVRDIGQTICDDINIVVTCTTRAALKHQDMIIHIYLLLFALFLEAARTRGHH